MKKLFLFFFFLLSTIILLPSPALADTTITSNITSNTTWTTASSTYILSGTITVNAGVTLTINPGVVVKFLDVNSALAVSGTLNASGSTSSPIYFTSYKDDSVGGDTNANGSANLPLGGDWRRIYVTGTSTMDHVVIRYGGGTSAYRMLQVHGGTATVTNSEIATSSYTGISNANSGTLSISYSDLHDLATTTSSSYFGLNHQGGTTTVTNSTIRNNSNYSLYSDNSSAGGTLTLTNNTFTNTRGGAVYLYLAPNVNFIHYNNVASGTGKKGIVIEGAPGGNQTWYADPYLPYIINSATGTITFSGQRMITVQAGSVFKFEGATAKIEVNNVGTLIADSSASTSPIYFTSIKDDTVSGDTNGDGSATTPAAGNWDMLKNNGTSTFNNVVIRYGGATNAKMLWSNAGTMTLVNSEIASSSGSGVYNDATLTATTSSFHHNRYGYYNSGGTNNIANNGNSIYKNSVYGIYSSIGTVNAERIYWPASTTGATMNGPYSTSTNPGGHGDAVLPTLIDFDPWVSTWSGNISSNTTWNASSTYVVDGTLTVDAGTTLTIYDGTVMKFKTAASEIVVNGTLDAKGGTSDLWKIHFTSYKDDTVGGDTNGDGAATSPAAGDWNGILVNDNGTLTIKASRITFGGYSAGRSTQIYNDMGTVRLENTEIATGTTHGIYNEFATLYTQLLVTACDIHGHVNGIYTETNNQVTITSNNIHGNSSYGLYNFSWFNVDAEYNYWGNASGPYNASQNASGTGNAVSNDVDFIPYLDQMHYIYKNIDGFNSAVDNTKRINFSIGTTVYTDAWYRAVNTWNTYGNLVGNGVIIATSTATSSPVLQLEDLPYDSSSIIVGQYVYSSQKLQFQPYGMGSTTNSALWNTQRNTTTHELGHALGLWHSYLNSSGNMMNSYVTGTTTLGVQDKLDYDYCWAGSNSVCRQ